MKSIWDDRANLWMAVFITGNYLLLALTAAIQSFLPIVLEVVLFFVLALWKLFKTRGDENAD